MKPLVFNYDDYLALKAEKERLTAAYIGLLKRSDDDICAVCKNRIECKGEDCEHYEKGNGMSFNGKEYPEMKWTCEDFNYGTCKKMENTPCQGCFDSNFSGFDWVGLEVEHE